jgi:hypothetical protein
MSNLSPKQFDVYRGLQTPGSQLNRKSLGVHWTDDKEVASDFGSGQGLGGYSHHRAYYKGQSSLIHAVTTPESVETDETKLGEYNLAMDQDESEIPLKEGVKVQVKSITTRRNKGLNSKVKSRVRRYKTPREMTT